MTHFQTPNSCMTPLQIQEVYDQLLDITVSLDMKKQLLRDIYKSLHPQSIALRNQIVKWYQMVEIPFAEIPPYLQVHLVPSVKSSDLAKKRKQTPRRHYTFRRRRESKH